MTGSSFHISGDFSAGVLTAGSAARENGLQFVQALVEAGLGDVPRVLVESDKAGITRLIVDVVRAGGSIFVGDDSVVARLAEGPPVRT